jgi:peptidoglycan/LPS O-acetylase OafA/YrhL
MEKRKYPGLDGLKAMSIILVVVFHLNQNEHIFSGLQQYGWLAPVISFITDGHFGVNVFFVISGFLITSLMLKEEKRTTKISLKNFYIRRTLRIFPAYYFMLFVYFLLQLAGFIHITGASWLTAITYTKYFNWNLDWLTSHAWSLSIEEHFYLIWPLIFMCGNAFRKKFAFFLLILVPLIRVYVNFYPVSWINELTIFTRIDAIAMGCVFAMYKDEIVEKSSSIWRPLFYGSIVVLFSLRYLPSLLSNIHLDFIFIPLDVMHGTIANLLIGIVMMCSVFGPQEGLWSKFLNSKIINFIGLLSYSIYLWQQLFISGSHFWVTKFPQNTLFILMMALFSYYVIEKPFLKLKSKFSADEREDLQVAKTFR